LAPVLLVAFWSAVLALVALWSAAFPVVLEALLEGVVAL